MTPKECTLRSASLPALLFQPVQAMIESPLSAKVLATLLAVVGYFASHNVFFIAFAFAFAASTMDYLIGYRLAENREVVDDAIASNGLLVKLTALALLLFVFGLDTWLLSAVAPSLSGMIATACAAIWIHKEMKSVDRHTAGAIPFVRPFLAVLDVVIGRLLPEGEADAERGIVDFVRRREDAAVLGEEPPERRHYDPNAVKVERELRTKDGVPFHDALALEADKRIRDSSPPADPPAPPSGGHDHG